MLDQGLLGCIGGRDYFMIFQTHCLGRARLFLAHCTRIPCKNYSLCTEIFGHVTWHGAFLKWWYPQKSSIWRGFSLRNPAIGVAWWHGLPRFQETSATTDPEWPIDCPDGGITKFSIGKMNNNHQWLSAKPGIVSVQRINLNVQAAKPLRARASVSLSSVTDEFYCETVKMCDGFRLHMGMPDCHKSFPTKLVIWGYPHRPEFFTTAPRKKTWENFNPYMGSNSCLIHCFQHSSSSI